MDILSKIMYKNKNMSKIQFNNIQNGRVSISGKEFTNNIYPLYEQKKNGNTIYKNEALKTIQTNSILSNLYFSEKNIRIIQENIKYNIWINSNKEYIIGKQSNSELKIIMRSIFLQYSKNINENMNQQVKYLNDIVIKYCVPNILSNIKQYLGYLENVSYLPIPLSHPLNLSVKGTKLYQ
jgi:hypothetical protein